MTPLRIKLAGFVVALSCCLAACEGNKTASIVQGATTPGAAEVGQKTAKTVGASGGQVSTPGKTASIDLPAGSLSGSVPVTLVVKDPSSVPQSAKVLSNVYDFGPSGTNFSQAATLAIKISSPPAAGQNPVLAYLDSNNIWQVLLGSSYDASLGTVTASTTHFTLFTVITVAADGTGCAAQSDPQAYCAEQNLICDLTLNRCATPAFTIGGTIGTLQGSITLVNNGNDTVTSTTGGSFQFGGTYSDHLDYNVVITQQPAGQTCTFSGQAAGTIQTASVALVINCFNNFSIGGVVSGLAPDGVVVLANGNDTLSLSDNIAFTFGQPVANSQPFNVQLVSEPNDQTCTLNGGQGLPQGANVTGITVRCGYNPVPLAASISGLVAGTTLTLGNGNAVVAAGSANAGSFVVAQGQVGDTYDIAIVSQPDGQTCTISQYGTGTVTPGDANAAIIACVPNTYTVGGTISGLLASNAVALSLGSETITLDATATGFNFTTPVTFAAPYAVSVSLQPTGQLCAFTGGVSDGNMVGENVTNLQLTCKVAQYVLGGTVSGLPAGSTLALTLNNASATAALAATARADVGSGVASTAAVGATVGGSATGAEVLLAANGAFSFATQVAYNQVFDVSFVNPPGQVCNIWGSPSDFSQAMPAGDFNGINVSCAPLAYSLGGRVTGLLDNAFLTVQNGFDTVTVANGAFVFPTAIASGADYNITILSPAGHQCDFGSGSHGAGTMGGQAIGNVAVRCGPAPYYVGGTITGLAAAANVVIQSDEDLIFAANGSYELPTPYPYASNYSVMVVSPAHQLCGFVNSPNSMLAQGVMPPNDLSSLDIYCTPPTYRLGGPVVGLVANTNVTLHNGADSISVTNGAYVFPTALAVSAPYSISITSPPSQSCGFGAGITGSGIVGVSDVTSMAVICAPQAYQLGGVVSGLQSNTQVTVRTGADSLALPNGPYVLPTTIPFGAAYSAQVVAPANQTCQFVSAGAPPAGSMPNQNVTTLNIACGTIFYSLGGQVAGLASNTRLTVQDGVDTISLANGTYTFPTHLVSGVGFNVTLVQPAGQACAFAASNSGTISSNVTNININCAPIPYALGGNVTNLLTNTRVTINNGSDSVQVGNGSYTLPTALNANANYNVSLVSPAGQTCTFNGNNHIAGQVQNANVGGLDVSCLVNQYFIGGTIAGLSRNNSVAVRNGLDAVIAANGNFALPTPIFLGSPYSVTLSTYGNQVCTFAGGQTSVSGTMVAAGVAGLQINCTAPAYTLGGTVAGLVAGATVTLTNGSDTISVGAGPYTFPTAIAAGASFHIGVAPTSAQTCSVTGGLGATGTMGSSSIVTANVVCVAQAFTLGGTVAGLASQANITLINGNDVISVRNGNFTFPTAVAYGAKYVAMIRPSAGQICQVIATGAAPYGVMPANAVTNLTVVCSASSFTLGGNIGGLTSAVGSVKLQNGNDTVVAGNGPYTFATTLITGADYNVTLTSPPGQLCTFTSDAPPAGTMLSSSINNINVSCAANAYSIGGKVANLLPNTTVQITNGADQVVTGNGPFTFATLLPISATYSAQVTSPAGQTCGFAGSGNSIAGIVGNGNVYGLYVLCYTNTYPLSVSVSGLLATNSLMLQNGADKLLAQNGNVIFPTQAAYGASYDVVFTSPVNQACAFDRSGTPSQGVVYAPTSLRIRCSTPTFPIGGYVSGLPQGVTVGLNNGNDAVAVPNGPFSMPTQVAWGASYSVAIASPAGYACNFAAAGSDHGVINGAAVTSINISCMAQVQTIGGHISGLLANTNILLSDASDLVVAGNGAYTMPTALSFATPYALTASGPIGQTCSFVTNALGANANTFIGTIGNTNSTNLDIACTTNAYAISGYVQGLPSNSNAMITVRNGNDTLQVGNGIFTLPTSVAYNAPYAVSIVSPAGQVCQYAGNANGVLLQGVMPAAAVQSLLVRCTAVTYALGGTVTGAVLGSQVFIFNGQDVANIVGNGNTQTYALPTPLTAGANYNVTVGPSSAQACALVAGVASAGVANASVTNLNVRCTPNTFYLGGAVAGLVGNSNVTLRNGSDTLVIGNGNYVFPTSVAYGAAFNPTIGSPQFETCQFVNHGLPTHGSMMAQDYTNLDVVCGGNTVTIGGQVTGIVAGNFIALYNGNDRIVTNNGNFTFAAPVVSGSFYQVSIGATPGQLCSFVNPNTASGTAGNTPVTSVAVTCMPQSYQLGGTLTRSLFDSNVTLQNGNDTIALAAGGQFTFPTPVVFGGNYLITRSVPLGETCKFAPSTTGDANTTFSGTMGAGDVTNANLTCVPNTSAILVSVSGLVGNNNVTVQNGNDALSVRNGQFTLPTFVPYESSYSISLSNSGNQTCSFVTGAQVMRGRVPVGGVNAAVVCITPQYTIGGTVAGLVPNTTVTLKNGNDTLAAAGSYSFPTSIVAGGNFNVTLVQPVGQVCGFGTAASTSGRLTAAINNLNVLCYPQAFPVSVAVSGLVGNNNVTLSNGNELASVGNGNYIFPTPVVFGGQIMATVSAPSTQTCQFANGTTQVGAVMSPQFSALQVLCRNNTYAVGGAVSGLLANTSIQVQNGNQLINASNGNFAFPGTLAAGSTYDVSFLPVAGQVCAFVNPNSSRGTVGGAVSNIKVACVTTNYALTGNVLNLLPNTSLTLSDNLDQLSVGNGPFTFPTPIGANLPYSVNAYAPVGQSCNFVPGNSNFTSGVMGQASAADLTVKCNAYTYTLGGSVSGLLGNANLVARSGNDIIRLSNGTFTLPTAIAYNSHFLVSLGNGGLQNCAFTGTFNGTVAQGMMPAASLQSLNVYCSTPSYTVGGTVTGLVGNTALQLQNNGDTVTTFGGTYTFPTSIAAGGNYNVTLLQPAGQTCNFVTATSSVGNVTGNVDNVNIACTPQQYTLGGSVTGLTSTAGVTLQNGNDVLVVRNGNYTFPTPVVFGAAYSAVVTSPNLQTCQFSANGTLAQSRMPGGAVTSLNVVCGTNAYTVSGSVQGLATNTNVTLRNGADTIAAGNGPFTFPSSVIAGANYSVMIVSPSGQQCAFATATYGQGVVQGAVTNVNVVCAAGMYSLGGTVSTLVANTNVTITNGNDSVSVGNGSFVLPTSLASNANYLLRLSSPAGQTCVVGASATAGVTTSSTASSLSSVLAGTVVNANVNFGVRCSINYYSLGGTVQGLQTGSAIVLKTPTDTLTQNGPGAFTFPTLLSYNAPYTVSVRSTGSQVCSFSAATGGNVIAGVMPANAVQSLVVMCYTPTYTVGGVVSGLSSNTRVALVNNGFDTVVTSNGNYTFTSPISAGGSYSVVVGDQPQGQLCTLPSSLSVGGPLSGNINNINVGCVPQFYPLGGYVSGLMPNVAVTLRNGNDRIVAGNGNFTFATQLGFGANYNVTLISPATQTCQVGGNPQGTMPSFGINGLNVVCGALQGNFTISGVVSNLMANTNVTLSDGIENITVGNGPYAFPSYVAGSSPYAINVINPPGQTCSFAGNGNMVSGVINGNVTGVGVQCTPNFYSLGGMVSGSVATTGNVTIRNGSDSISVGAGGFTLPTLLAFNAPYSVSVSSSIPYLTCGFAGSQSTSSSGANSNIIQGVMPAYPLQSLYVMCNFPTYSVGGTVTGLVPNTSVQVINNGLDGVTSFGGNYTFSTYVQAGSNYNVTLVSPPGQTCSVTGAAASGNVTTGAIANVNVSCTPQRFSLGGMVAGLSANNLVTLTNGNDRVVVGNGNYTFPTPVAYGLGYNANVISPNYQTCQFSALPGSGVMPGVNVAQLNVQCGSQQGNFTVAGAVSGLEANASVTVTRGTDSVTVGNGAYQLPTQVHGGDSYTVSVTSPAGLSCAFAGGGSTLSGIVSSIVGNLPIQCTPATYALGGVVSPGNFPQGANVIIRNGNDTITVGTGEFTLPTQLAYNANYMVSVGSSMPFLSCGFAGTANSSGTNSNVISGVMPAGPMRSLYIMCSIPSYGVGGTVSGLLPNSSFSIYNNGFDGITSFGGTFQFPTYVQAGQNYNVTITQPPGQSCTLAANVAAAGVVTGSIANLDVNCVPQQFTLGGAVTGLIGSNTLALANGNDTIVVSNGNYTFLVPVAFGSGYNATITSPANETCRFTGLPGSGVMPNNAINQLNVGCAAQQGNFQISGSVNRLVANASVILSDGVDTISVPNGPFVFPTALHTGVSFGITIQSPPGQNCSFAASANNTTGVINGPVTGVSISCVPYAYAISGIVSSEGNTSGANANVVIRNGNDIISLTSGAFSLPTLIAYNAPFALSASSANPYGTCNISVPVAANSNIAVNGNTAQGLMPALSLQSVYVSCYVPVYLVGGTVSGLNPNTPLQVADNGNDALVVTNGSFTFPQLVQAGGNYTVTLTQPTGQTCSIASGTSSGTATASSFSSVSISCVPQQYVLGGRVSGLSSNSNVTLRNGNDVVTMGNGNYTFASRIPWGANYSATLAAPSGQFCQFSPLAGSGMMPANAVTNLNVICGASTYLVGGQVTGLLGNTNVLLRNGNDAIFVANGNFTFPTGVVPGGTYSVSVTSPQNQGCAFVNPNISVGTPTANVSNLAIACVQGNFTIRGTVSSLVANTNVLLSDGVDTVQLGNGAFSFPSPLVAGTSYTVSILGVSGQSCSFSGNSNTLSGVITGNVTGLAVQCAANAYAIGGVVSPGSFPAGATVTIRNGNDVVTTGSGSFTLPTSVMYNAPYVLSVTSNYPYLSCNAAGNSNSVVQGVMTPYNLSLYIMCSVPSYPVGGTVTGLVANTSVSVYNGVDGITSYGGNFIFPTQVVAGGNFAVSIGQSQGQTCSLAQGSPVAGTVTGAIGNINVVCTPQRFTIGGSVAGLNANNQVSLLNGQDSITVSNGNFTLPTAVAYGANFNITLVSSNSQSCQFINLPPVGVMQAGPITQINVFCAAAQGNFQISGNVSNLLSNTNVVLYDGFDTISIGNGPFAFPTLIGSGSGYFIGVQSPLGQTCIVNGNTNFSGQVNGPVSGLHVQCTTNTYTLGGYASGAQNSNVVIRNGNDVVSLAAGTFTFSTPVAYNAPFNVSATSANPYATCSVSNAGVSNGNSVPGVMPAQSVQTISINCFAPLYTIGGVVSGLNPNTPLQVIDNGTDTTYASNGNFYFPTAVQAGGNYMVTLVQSQGQTCSVVGAAGGMVTTNGASVAINCVPQQYIIGGRISGLTSNTNVTLRNGNDLLAMGNGNYTFPTRLLWGANYSASVTAPSGQYCQFTPIAGAGVMPSAAITNLNVVCGTSVYTLAGHVSGLANSAAVTLRNGNDTLSVTNGNFTFPTGVVPGGSYSINVNSPQGQGCAFVNPNLSFGAPSGNVNNLAIACVQGNFTVGGTVSNLVTNTNILLSDGVDTVSAGNGAFVFPSQQVAGTHYTVFILGADGQTCNFAGSGNTITGTVTGNVGNLNIQCTPNTYLLGGVVSPGYFPQGATVTISNGNDVITTGSGSFALPTPVTYNAPYAMSVTSSYPYLVCRVAGNTNSVVQGLMPSYNMSFYIMCSVPSYSVGGTVTGLAPNTSISLYNGPDGILSYGGSFTFPTQTVAGGNYNVMIGQTQGEMCTFAQGSQVAGTVTGPITNINIVCNSTSVSLGVTVSGVAANGNLTLSDGIDTIYVGNGAYAFPTPLGNSATNYTVALQSPVGQSCIFNGSNTSTVSGVASGSMTNLNVSCTTNAYTVGGFAGNTGANGNIVISSGNDVIRLSSGAFTLPTPIAFNAPFTIAVGSTNPYMSCYISDATGQSSSNGNVLTGTINTPYSVKSIYVNCNASMYQVGGVVSGLSPNTLLQLADNGTDTLQVSNGNFTFATWVSSGSSYAVTFAQPTGQTCSVVQGSSGGTITNGSVSNIGISCTTLHYTLGGRVTGLSSNTNVTLRNGNDTIVVANSNYTFPTSLVYAGNYNVTAAAPSGQICQFSSALPFGAMPATNVSTMNVICGTTTYQLAGRVSGLLTNTNVILKNGATSVSVTNGNFTFATGVVPGGNYNVSITSPQNQGCAFTNPNVSVGTPAGDVNNLIIACLQGNFTIGGTVSSAIGNTNFLLTDGVDTMAVGNGSFSFPTRLPAGSNYTISVAGGLSGQTCQFNGNANRVSGTLMANMNAMAVQCSANAYAIGGVVSPGGMPPGATLTLSDGYDVITTTSGSFTFPTPVTYNTNYVVKVLNTSVPGMVCNFSGGGNGNTTQGVMPGNPLTSLYLTCSLSNYPIGGTLTGLSVGSTVVANDGIESVTLSNNGSYSFPSYFRAGNNYAVTLALGHSGCIFVDPSTASGMVLGPVNNISIDCSAGANNSNNSGLYRLGGTVWGLIDSTSVMLANGNDMVAVMNGSYTFTQHLPVGANYNVTVLNPPGQVCVPMGGPLAGTMGNYDELQLNFQCSLALSFNTFQGGSVVFGQNDLSTATLRSVAADSVNQPRGRVFSLGYGSGNTYFPDFANSRALIMYGGIPIANGSAATDVLGQSSLNGNVPVTHATASATAFAPSDIAGDLGTLVMADPSNNRVLVWNDGFPGINGNIVAATLAVGQPALTGGNSACSASGLNAPLGAATGLGWLVIADTNNNRVLVMQMPSASGASASVVLGQSNFATCSSNAGNAVSGNTLSSPTSVWTDGNSIFVADSNNHRVLFWRNIPTANGVAADVVFGQANMASQAPGSTAARLNGPTSITSDGVSLFVADTNNNRVLVFSIPTSAGVPQNPTVVLGQPGMTTTACNQGGLSGASLCRPMGVSIAQESLIVTDSGNNRFVFFFSN